MRETRDASKDEASESTRADARLCPGPALESKGLIGQPAASGAGARSPRDRGPAPGVSDRTLKGDFDFRAADIVSSSYMIARIASISGRISSAQEACAAASRRCLWYLNRRSLWHLDRRRTRLRRLGSRRLEWWRPGWLARPGRLVRVWHSDSLPIPVELGDQPASWKECWRTLPPKSGGDTIQKLFNAVAAELHRRGIRSRTGRGVAPVQVKRMVA